MPARLLARNLPADAGYVYVGPDAFYVTCSGHAVLAVSRRDGTLRTLRTRCTGGNVAGDARGIFVLDVRARRIQCDEDQRVLVEGAMLSGIGVLDPTHLYFTTTDALCRVAREGGRTEVLVRADEPALLGVGPCGVVFTVGSYFEATNSVHRLVPGEREPRRVPVPAVRPGCVRLADSRVLSLDDDHVLRSTDLETGSTRTVLEMRTLPEHARRLPRRPFLKSDASHVHFEGASERGGRLACRWSETAGLESWEVPEDARIVQGGFGHGAQGYGWLVADPRGHGLWTWSD